jgi:predicted lysophospholipase L1 biosynthesis ABC-type transport system permease subunit
MDVMAGVLLWVRGSWRRGRAGMLGMIILCGVAGAVVLTVAAGARRSSTSLDRLADATGAADVVMDVTGVDPTARDAVRALPMVADSGELSVVFAVVDGVEQDLGLFIPQDDRFGAAVEHDRFLRGRPADPDRADEVTVNELAAEVIGVDVGDEFSISTLTPDQVATEDYFPPRGPNLHVRVVGVTRGPEDLIANGEAGITASPALLDVVSGRVDVFATYLGVRLVPGATVAEFEDSLGSGLAGGTRDDVFSFDTRTKSVRDAISTIVDGLVVFAIAAGAASIVVVGLAVGRHLARRTHEQEVLVALGMSPVARFAGLVSLVAPIATGGALLAVAGAVLASPLMPIGLARRAEPDPGFAVDWWVVTVGFLGVVAVVVGSAALAAWRTVRSRRAVDAFVPPSSPRVAASRSGAGPALATGVELAFDRRPPTIPSRSAIVGVTLAVTAVTAIFTFSSTLDRLVTTPDRWGYTWQLMLNFNSSEVDRAAAELAADTRFTGVARWDSGFSYVNGAPVRASGLTPLRGDVGYALRSGHQPAAADEVVLGPATADDLHVNIGDVVDVAADPSATPGAVHVVGIALFREIDEGDLTNGVGYLGSGFEQNATVPDLFEASQVVVTTSPGRSVEDIASALDEQYPDAISGESLPTAPGGVGNLMGVRSLPRAIAAFMVALGLASLTHALATTVGRRRHDLATLRSIGLTPRQTRACIVWQAVTIGAVGLVLGVPLGLIVGRGAWWAAADPIGVGTDISRPVGALVMMGVGTLVAAAGLATVVAWRSSRTAPAVALRTE